LPAGFAGAFSAGSLSIGAGASVSTNWSVSSSSTVASGTYAFDASVAEVGGGSSTTAHASDIVYVDTTAPSLTITSPLANSTVNGRVSIIATASDATGINWVEFYVDGNLIGRDTGSPYSANWNARKANVGPHDIVVKAIDKAGNSSSQTLSVTVK
jgi:hypothetical protein